MRAKLIMIVLLVSKPYLRLHFLCPSQMKTIEMKLARKDGIPLKARAKSAKLFGMLPIEITSIVVAKANAASTKVSNRVVSNPRNLKSFSIGRVVIFSSVII